MSQIIIEKIVAAQLIHYLDINNLLSTYQSGLRKARYTDTLIIHPLATSMY